MKVKRLKEILANLPDDADIHIRNSRNICGTIAELEQVEKTYMDCFPGQPFPYVILNSAYTGKKLERSGRDDDPLYYDYVEYGEDGKTLIRKEYRE